MNLYDLDGGVDGLIEWASRNVGLLHNAKPIEQDANAAASLYLWRRHPEAEAKIGPGVETIEIRAATYGTRCFWVMRIDGSCTDFSWRSCLRAPRPIDDFRKAMRWAVVDQTASAMAAK